MPPPPKKKKNTHSSVVMTREFIHTHTKSRHTTFTQSLWMCIIYMTYQAEADDWLDPERHQEGPDSQFDINQVLEETPGFLPNCISMILILFSAGKRIFGGLLVNGAAKKKKNTNIILILCQHSQKNEKFLLIKKCKTAMKSKTAKNPNHWRVQNTDMVK